MCEASTQGRVCISTGRPSTTRSTQRPDAVFICAAGHSGSTLLDLLLGSHPHTMSLGEITQLPKNLALNTACSCGEAVRSCPLWSAVLASLSGDERFPGFPDDPYALYLGMFEATTVVDREHQTAWRQLRRRLIYAGAFAHWRWRLAALAGFAGPLQAGAANKWALFQAVAEIADRPVLIDSSKHYLEALALYRSAPERTRIVLLVRDGRAVFHSGLKRGRSRRQAVDAWRQTYRRALPLLRTHVAAGHLLRTRYEDLTSDPARELQRICRFIGVGYDPGMLEFRSRPHHLLNGNDMRLATEAAIRVDEAWKRKLSVADLDYFEARAGRLNRELGY